MGGASNDYTISPTIPSTKKRQPYTYITQNGPQTIASFILDRNFPTDEFCAELPLQNVINNSPCCVEFVLLKSVLLLIP